MRLAYIPFLFLLLQLSGCGNDESAPEAVDVLLNTDQSILPPGANVRAWIVFYIDTAETDVTKPFSLRVMIPPFVAVLPGSPALDTVGPRPPDAEGVCADGSQFLVFNFGLGEIPDQFHMKEFNAALSIDMLALPMADGQRVSAQATTLPPVDPCLPITENGASDKISVKQ